MTDEQRSQPGRPARELGESSRFQGTSEPSVFSPGCGTISAVADGPPPLPGAAPRKGRSGCLTALYIVLGLGVAAMLLGGIGLWVFLRSETGQKLVGGVRGSITLLSEAARAPGTPELRAAGCSQALVLPMRRMRELFGDIASGDTDGSEPAHAGDTVVFCQITSSESSNLDCGEVARIYTETVKDAPERFVVTVQGGSSQQCQGRYARDGSLIESLERPADVERPAP